MKKLSLLLVAGIVAGCGAHSAAPVATASQQDSSKKLLALPPEQRADYFKTHMSEFTGGHNARPGAAPPPQ